MKKFITAAISCGAIFAVLWLLRLLNLISDPLILSLIGAGVFFVASVCLKLLSPRIRPVRFFSLKPMRFLDIQLSLSAAVLLICGSFLLNFAVSTFYGWIGVSVPDAFSGGGYSSPGIAILCIAVLPAVFEEIYFRGALLTLLRGSGLKIWAVACCGALAFMLLHGTGWYFLSNFYAGAVLTLLVLFTGSLYSAVIAHFLSNFASYFLALYGGKLQDAGIENLLLHLVIVCLLGGACHTLHLIKKLIIKNEKEDRSNINENSRRWEEQKAKGERSDGKEI